MKTLISVIFAVFSTTIFVSTNAQVIIPLADDFFVIPLSEQRSRQPVPNEAIYYNDFTSQADGRRIDQFVAYRDPFVIAHTTGRSDHASTGGIDCTLPEETRTQTRGNPKAHVYQCLPMGNSDAGHQMAFAMNTAGYGFVGALPDQVFTGVSEVLVDINTTSAGTRNFIEIKVVPADNVFVNGLPCVPDFPCNGGWDYDDIGAVGAATPSQEGTGLIIATPSVPDGYRFDRRNSFELSNGDTQYNRCSDSADDYCSTVRVHQDNISIRNRFQHIFRDNGDGTLSFGIEATDGHFDWVQAPGSFPTGPVRVVIAFHNYTGTKDNNGPGFDSNLSPSEGGFTWHWDELTVKANSSTPSIEHFGGISAERIITPDDCVAFSQGQRENSHHRDVPPRFHCEGDAEINF